MNKSWVTTFVGLLKSIWSSLILSLKTNVGKDVHTTNVSEDVHNGFFSLAC